ncbi:MAG: GGDEF domain-containing protein [Pseudomonadales bacterium]|nr:GGDEF domain-containing protein [Pseudomonadales bacterium]
MELDPQTFIVASMLAALMMMIIFFGQARSFPKSIKGFNVWGIALFTVTLAAALLAARGFIPGPVSIVLGNGLLALGIALMIVAISIFHNNPVPWKLSVVCVVFVVAGMVWCLSTEQEQKIRTILGSGSNTVLLGMVTWAILKGRDKSQFQLGIYFSSICAGITTLTCFARLVTLVAGIGEPHGGLLDESPVQRIYLMSYNINVLLASVGFSIMGHEKLVDSYQALASRDGLTGLYSRTRFIELAEREAQRAERYHCDISLVLIDIDNFKQINDTCGHQAGDAVIKDIAAVMHHNFRDIDLLGRYGGEEFIALLPETPMVDAKTIVERVRSAVDQRTVVFEGGEITYSASFGVAQAQPGLPLEKTVGQADKALYHAKKEGKNRVEVFPLVIVPESSL